MIVDLPETTHKCLLVAGILTTSHLGVELVHHLVTIAQIVLHGCSTGLVVKHVEHLPKVHRSTIRSTVSDQPEHDTVRVVHQLDVLIHPHLP
uniref:AC5 protein n=1 Tax=Sida yellow net virus TaxID=1266977 RepID=A0A2Z4N708_9GEMI|nr:AC5 protein [Sida yellow net virus]